LSALARRAIWVVALVVVVAAVFGVVRFRQARKPTEPLFESAQVDRGKIVAKVTATGTVSALVTVQVGSQVSGRVQELFADFNSSVIKGELLAKIDPQLFEAALAEARANYTAARGNLVKARVQSADAARQYRRARTLASQKLVAPADLDTAKATADAARAQVTAAKGAVEQARAALEQAQVNLDYTDIVSPTDGVVISRNVDVGQTVAAAFQAPVLFVIAADLRQMQVDTSVAEADIGKLEPKMEASFTVDAYPGVVFRGKVRQIRNSPQTVQNVVTYDAVIDVENPDLKLKPGMTANVTFVYAQKANALRVPNPALRFTPTPEQLAAKGPSSSALAAPPQPRPSEQEGKRSVWVVRDGQPNRVEITPGISDGTFTEVVSGPVHEGDQVATDARQPPEAGQSRGFRMF
jgi:HlyD family secretion protein